MSLPFAPASQAIAVSDATTVENPADRGSDEQTVRREVDRFRAARISLERAMAIAEALHAGSTAADISFDGTSATSVYRIKTVWHDRVWRHVVDATSGEARDGEAASPLRELDVEDRNNLVELRALRHHLSDAVRVAELTTSGKAISGGLMRERGKLNFVIVVVSGDDLKQVILEPPGARRRK